MRLIYLSDIFYEHYANCKEILQKKTRPYVCLEITIGNTTFAIPFRHHINHKYAFITVENCGLDYTKAVVISHENQVSVTPVQIEQAEFNAIKGKERRIHKGMSDYVKLYKKALKYNINSHYANILRYSSLKYFLDYI